MSIAIGKPFPQIPVQAVLPGGKTGPFSVTDAKGKWSLFVFYPFSFTGVCESEVAALKARFAEFEARGVVVAAASCDSVHTQKKWIEANHGGSLPYVLLADFKKELATALGILHEGLGASFRGTFLVDPEGVVRSYGVNDLAIGRSTDEMLRLIDAFQSGGACMVDWKKQ